MGTAQIQGSLWGTQVQDYAEIVEPFGCPLYEAVFQATEVRTATRLLDVGCGPGLAGQLAATRGARVAGLDAAEASIAIARERTPEGDFQAGEMENLPWTDNTFDLVTGFNAFQYAADVVCALPGGQASSQAWGAGGDGRLGPG